jgi:hypothetical protein
MMQKKYPVEIYQNKLPGHDILKNQKTLREAASTQLLLLMKLLFFAL